jgi:hypothetical protein
LIRNLVAINDHFYRNDGMPRFVLNQRRIGYYVWNARRLLVLVACLGALLANGSVMGGTVPALHSAATTASSWSGGDFSGYGDYAGNRAFGQFFATDSGGGSVRNSSDVTLSVSGSATSRLVGGRYWELGATTSVSASYPDGNLKFISAYQESNAYWQDVLYLSNTDPALVGHTVRLNFVSTGSVGDPVVSNIPVRNPMFVAGVGAIEEAEGSNYGTGQGFPGGEFFSHSAPLVIAAAAVSTSGTDFTHSNWDTFAGGISGGYGGTWHLDIPLVGSGYIDGIPGSVYFQVHSFVHIQSNSIDGAFGTTSMSASITDPTSFLSVTLPDVGNVTPESLGVSVTFASGAVSPNLTSTVPEPSAIVVASMLFGMFGGVWAYERRMRGVRAA